MVVDGHPVVRLGVRELLRDEYEVEEASNWRGALDVLTQTGGVDVAIVELERCADGSAAGAAGGAAVIRALHKAMPGMGIVAHARRPESHAAREAIEAGASAYVAKSSPPEALSKAVEAAARSERFIDPAVNGGRPARLTKRQREILQLLADGLSTTEIAHHLGLSAETIRTHTKGLLARLEARDRAHAVALGMRLGVID